MADVRILNFMKRDFTLNLTEIDSDNKRLIKPVNIPSGKAVTVDKAKFDAACKGNKTIKALIDQKRLVVGNAAGTISTPDEKELHQRSSEAKPPPELQDTKDATSDNGKVKHKVEKVEMVEVEQGDNTGSDAPSGGKRDS